MASIHDDDAPHALLNPEPADPKERDEHSLPPKSYADAVTDDSADGSNGLVNGLTNGTNHRHALKSRKQLDENKIVYEKHLSADQQIPLTSVKPDDGYEESLKHNGEIAPKEKKSKQQDTPKSQLASGRRAGAGWETSAYVLSLFF
jgi:hypothetical protein